MIGIRDTESMEVSERGTGADLFFVTIIGRGKRFLWLRWEPVFFITLLCISSS